MNLIAQPGDVHGLCIMALSDASRGVISHSFISLLDTFALRVYISNHPTSFFEYPLPAAGVSMNSLEILQPEP